MNKNDKNELYNKIKTQLEPFEHDRINYLWKMGVVEVFLLMILPVLFFYSHKIFDTHTKLAILLGMLAFIFLVVIIAVPYYLSKMFKRNIKYNCKCIIEKAFNLQFLNYGIFDMEKLQKSNLFSKFHKMEVDDTYKGSYKDVEYKVQETKLLMKDSRRDYTQFKGVIIGFKFNKHINTPTIIVPKNDFRIMNNYNFTHLAIILSLSILMPLSVFIFFLIVEPEKYNFRAMLPILFQPESLILFGIIAYFSVLAYKKCKIMRKTELEDIDFNKEYKVHTENEVEARYLITTSFMTRYMVLQKVFHTKKIKCSFFDNEVIFAIETNKDMFELGSLYHSLKIDSHSFDSKNKDIEGCIAQIIAIQNLIDHFKLDEKTGL